MRILDRLHAALWLWRAAAALKAGKLQKAMERTEIVEEIAPSHPGLKALRGEVMAALLARSERQVKEQPDEPEWRGDYARALMDQKRFQDAAAQVRVGLRLLKDDPRSDVLLPEMLQIAGQVAYNCGEYARAIDLLTRGQEPGFAMASVHYCRGLSYLAMGDRTACRREFTPLVQQAHWAVPMRYQEFLQERRHRDQQTEA